MTKFTKEQRPIVKNIVANLSITRAPEIEIVQEIERQTGIIITTRQVYNIRNQIKRQSFKWYQDLQKGKYSYLHEFRAKY